MLQLFVRIQSTRGSKRAGLREGKVRETGKDLHLGEHCGKVEVEFPALFIFPFEWYTQVYLKHQAHFFQGEF